MPCYYTGSAEGDNALIAKEALTKKTNTLSKVTAMLCKMCELYDDNDEANDNDEIKHMPDDIDKWWRKHKERDRKRKLTPKKVQRKKKGRTNGNVKRNRKMASS